jgi:hypothetical protein
VPPGRVRETTLDPQVEKPRTVTSRINTYPKLAQRRRQQDRLRPTSLALHPLPTWAPPLESCPRVGVATTNGAGADDLDRERHMNNDVNSCAIVDITEDIELERRLAMRIYIHREAHNEAEALDSPAEGSIAGELTLEEGELVLLENQDEPLDTTLSFEAAGVDDRGHVFRGRRHPIEVSVEYNTDIHERQFGASTRVERVFKWAVGKRAFDLGEVDAAEHTLALADETVPAGDVHLGSLDQSTPGRVAFLLVAKHRHEG